MSDNTEKRIRLAEAMGWERVRYQNKPRQIRQWRSPTNPLRYRTADELPNPEHDANDDYAVLEWMRSQPDLWDAFINELASLGAKQSHYYTRGDYARAALRALKDE